MRFLFVLLAVPLAGCSYTTYMSGADAHGGTINGVVQLNRDSAIEKANAHCRQYNLVARVAMDDPASNSFTFVCQLPPRDEPLTDGAGQVVPNTPR